jgi:hypothetical protein
MTQEKQDLSTMSPFDNYILRNYRRHNMHPTIYMVKTKKKGGKSDFHIEAPPSECYFTKLFLVKMTKQRAASALSKI